MTIKMAGASLVQGRGGKKKLMLTLSLLPLNYQYLLAKQPSKPELYVLFGGMYTRKYIVNVDYRPS